MGPFEFPVSAFRTGLAATMMLAEAQQVMLMRFLGMAGLWSVQPSETARMVSEKLPALSHAARAALDAAARGGRPDQIAAAWLKPVARRTAANRRRLTRRGPRLLR